MNDDAGRETQYSHGWYSYQTDERLHVHVTCGQGVHAGVSESESGPLSSHVTAAVVCDDVPVSLRSGGRVVD